MNPLVVIVILAVLFWVLFALPARRRRRDHEAMQDDLEIGNEIITAGGMHGVVHELDDRQLRIRIIPVHIFITHKNGLRSCGMPTHHILPAISDHVVMTHQRGELMFFNQIKQHPVVRFVMRTALHITPRNIN